MNKKMTKKSKFAVAIAGTVLAGTLAIGAVASAAGSDNSGVDPSARPHLTTQQKCDKQTEISNRVTTMKQRIDQRIANLEARKTKAAAAGHTERVQRLQQRIDRLHKVETRIDTRYAKYESWVQANCTAP